MYLRYVIFANLEWKKLIMDALRKAIIEEVAFEGPRGIHWPKLLERLQTRSKSDTLPVFSTDEIDAIKDELVSNDVIESDNGNDFSLVDDSLRLQLLGVSHLSVVSDNPQSLRILELVAKGRTGGAWSFHLCAALRVDPKQLFHLSNVLVEFRLVERFSNVTVPRNLKSQTSGSSASFFILSRFSRSSDPEVADVVDPSNSTENVCSLILTLLREAGGVMMSKPLRTAVVIEGGFTGKQYRRGRDRLSANRRVEIFQVPKSDDNDLDDDDDEDKSFDYVQAVRLLEAHELLLTPPTPSSQDFVKEEDVPDESGEEILEAEDDEELFKAIRVRNALRSHGSFRSAILAIIAAGGTAGVTTKDISRLTGVGSKEILKAMETLRNCDSVDTAWKNDGKRKYIVYKPRAAGGLTISVDDASTPSSTPQSSGKGYVTDQTMRRSVIAADIVSSRGALSLIDLGRAIEQTEVASGTGIPGVQIDRRTLKKICDISKIPLVEKGEAATSKIIIAFDPTQMDANEAMRRIDRPVGITPKSASSASSSETKPVLISKRLSIPELVARGRLAALAVLGPSATNNSRPKAPSYAVAENYGLIRSRDVFVAKLFHFFLTTTFPSGSSVSLQEMMDEMPLVLLLQVVGCGVVHEFVDQYLTVSGGAGEVLRLKSVPVEVRDHLRQSVPSAANVIATTPLKQLAKILVPLTKLGLVSVVRNSGSVAYKLESSFGDSAEEYWASLYRQCMDSASTGNPLPATLTALPQLMKKNQWKSKIVVPISQRRTLDSLLRKFVSDADSARFTSVSPMVVDGSNPELVRVCASIGMDSGAALKVLKQLYSAAVPANSGSGNVVFASVNQARFSCPRCGQLFFQLASIQRHIEGVHGEAAPQDVAEFTRPEYLAAIQNLRTVRQRSADDKKRRRRRRRRVHVDAETMTAVEVIELTTAHALATSVLGDASLEGKIWALMAQILGTSESVDIVRVKTMMALQQRSSVKLHAGERREAGSGKVEKLASLMVLNKILEADQVMIDSLSRLNAVDMDAVHAVMRAWHASGVLAIERRIKGLPSQNDRTYCLSRFGKISVFGKFSEIEKFLSVILQQLHAGAVDSVDAEIAHDAVLNAVLLEDIGSLFPAFEDELVSPEKDDIDDDEFTGIKRHLELAGAVAIDRVDVSGTPLTPSSSVVSFVHELIRLNQSSLSNVWRPERSAIELNFDLNQDTLAADTLAELQKGTRDINQEMHALGSRDGDVTVARPENCCNLMYIVARASRKFFIEFAPPSILQNLGWQGECPPVKLRTWTAFDGRVKEHILADLLVHCLYLVYAHPGISVHGIVDRLLIVPREEVELLLSPLKGFGLVKDGGKGQLFFSSLRQS